MTTIREAISTDAQAIAQLHVAAWKIAYKGCFPDEVLDNLNVQEFSDNWRKTLEERKRQVVVAVTNDTVVGFCCFTATLDPEEDPSQVGEILAIYLHPDSWRGGIGTILTTHVFDALRLQGFKSVMLWVLDENTRARTFYEQRLGMRPSGKTRVRTIRGATGQEVQYITELTQRR